MTATVADVTRDIRSMPTKLKRKVIRVHPEVMDLLEDMKETLHNYASPQSTRAEYKEPLRRPFSWNEFFTMIVSDWRAGRSKCHCGHFTDCAYCETLRRQDKRNRLLNIQPNRYDNE